MNVILQTERLMLRCWTPAAVTAHFEMAGDAEVMRYIGTGKPFASVEESLRWIERNAEAQLKQGFSRWAVVERSTGEVVGSCGFGLVEGVPEPELGFLFRRDAWGRGFATEAAGACLSHGFETLKFPEIVAVVVPEHIASRRVLEKCGFVYKGLRLFAGEEEADAYYVAVNPSAVASS